MIEFLEIEISLAGTLSLTLMRSFNGFPVFLKGNWSVSSFFAGYVTLMIFAVCYGGWKLAKRTRLVPLMEIDFVTGRRELDEMEERDHERFGKPESWFQKVMSILF